LMDVGPPAGFSHLPGDVLNPPRRLHLPGPLRDPSGLYATKLRYGGHAGDRVVARNM